jgi:protein-S-isoprenylcysteine O-methyltransferase Ste14
MSRVVIFVYGIVSYLIALVVFLYGVGFMGDFVTPTTLDGAPRGPLGASLAIDLGLLVLFSVQHSVMARPAFKAWWTQIVPEAAERSTYVLLSSLAMIAIYAWWQPIGGVVWEATTPLMRGSIIGLYLAGWALLFYTTFLIDHFDLFGLRQVWRKAGGAEYIAPKFYTPSLYRLVRHPLYIGWLVIFWATPTMTIAHLVFALGTTAYILFAIQLEEHDLVTAFGDDYVEYRSRTPMLVPRLWRRRPMPASDSSWT